MTRADSQDLLGCLLQKYKKASSNVQSQKTVLNSYKKINDISSAVEAINNRREQLLKALEELADIGQKALTATTRKVQELEVLNRDLTAENTRLRSDLERLKLEYRRQIGVTPKAMSSKEKGNQDATSTGNDRNDILAYTEDENAKPKRRGAPKGHRGNTRAIPSKVDSHGESPLPSQCDCGCSTIIPTDETDTKYIEDILPVCSHITEIKYPRGRCSECGSLVRHKDAKYGPPVSIGPNISAHLVLLRQRGATYRKISFFCTETLGIPLSPSGVLGVVSRSAGMLRPTNREIFSAVRKQSVLNADETGWPIAYKSLYIWGFCNTNLAYFHADKSRGAKVPKAILGENFEGTVLCD